VSRLRVLLFGRYADAETGGIERHVRSVVEALQGEVDFVNLVEGRGFAAARDWPCPVEVSRALAVVASLPICPGMPAMARALHARHRFHIAHLHLPDPMSHFAAASLPPEVRIVVTWHSDIVRQRSLYGLYRPLLRRLMARARVVVAATPVHFTSMPQLGELAPQAKRVVVPFGFELARYRAPHPRADELRKSLGPKLVFALGRHVYYKGFEYLVRAMARLPEARLAIGGTGPLTASLRAAAADAGVADRVVFAGRIAEADLPAYYQACEVFCLPAVEPSEAFGIVQVEAMAAGKPVVCSELHNGITWVNQHGVTGLAVPPRDEAALAAALGRLLGDAALRKRLGDAGAARAASAFSLGALAAGTLGVYQKALAASA